MLARRRQPRADSLPTAIGEILDKFEVPIPTSAMRLLLGARLGEPVAAGRLSRIAAFERDAFLRTNLPPRLCCAIDADAAAISPRIWARGSWRLQRRVMTDDVVSIWSAALAERLCADLSQQTGSVDGQLAQLAVAAAARVIGPARTFAPTSSDEWLELRAGVVQAEGSVINNRAGATPQQVGAETAFQRANLPGVRLYFGTELPS
ncbi:hypothetical protein Q5424_04950 [Conexibacter sp. JD483]|uniref:hypothetical protein n=1 Tax=unclassified Conexibacter TaxID=2627773 RepID=UPI00271AFD0A|nr:MULTISPECIES: hypothetical protein [unclassified Conexibacter]MDO8184681.1 hypothetical protein [Conexibacter sp. CPCC 205706]MDO8197987.1 hypothetical protein [Conexibacter sp. CPCC 205762]MDR9368417.1 hypothetical protein [Conexibacter sp. JD483]